MQDSFLLPLPTHELTRPQRLAVAYLDTIRTTRPVVYWRQSWWRWTGVHYRQIERETLEGELFGFIDREFKARKAGREPGITRALIANVLGAVRDIVLQPGEQEAPFSLVSARAGYAITFQNGTLDLLAALADEPAAFRSLDPCWFTPVALPFDYDPEATCPLWDRFLSEIMEGDQERIDFIAEWMGYCAAYDYRHQFVLILVGEGQNGKGVWLRTLISMLGDENVSHVPLDLFGQRFQLYNTLGKLVNTASEIGQMTKQAEEQLKAFTGGDSIYVDIKGRQGITIKPTARLIFSTNDIPHFQDRSFGLRRRLIILPFGWTVPNSHRDPTLETKLLKELPGIFNFAMEGLHRLRLRGDFDIPTVCRQAVDSHLLESNPARRFLAEATVLDRTQAVSSSDLYDEYRSWAKGEGLLPRQVLNHIQFVVEVGRFGGSAIKTSCNFRAPGAARKRWIAGLAGTSFEVENITLNSEHFTQLGWNL